MIDGTAIGAVGMFDGVHLGHRHLLNTLASEAKVRNLKPIAFTFAQHPAAILHPAAAPAILSDTSLRADIIRHCGIEDVVVLNYTADDLRCSAKQFISKLRNEYGINTLVMGYDNHIGSDRLNGSGVQQLVPSTLPSLVVASPYTLADGSTPSSSAIRAAVANADMAAASNILGYHFTVRGKVAEGRRIGRTIGFPTANVVPLDTAQLLPPDGAYAVDVLMPDNNIRRAAANIGFRPTLNDGRARTLEVHIPGFSGDLYGSQLDVRFLKFLRPERRFDSLDALAAQLNADTAKALEF